MEESSLKLGIDASGAKAGKDQYVAALNQIETAVNKLDTATMVAFAKIKGRLAGVDFSKAAHDIATIGSMRVDANLASHLTAVSKALSSFRTPGPTASTNLTNFGRAIRNLNAPNVNPQHLSAIGASVANFRAPSAHQTSNLNAFVQSLNNMRITANVQQVVAQLQQITRAATDASNALRGVRALPQGAYIPRPRAAYTPSAGGSGGGYGGGSYGPRSSIVTGPYDGIFSGHNRATGELRGLENVANPSFQMASVLRSMVPALTAGEMFKSLYDEGSKLTAFQHTLEVATTVPENAIQSQRNLADAMKFVSETANKYGMALQPMRDGFSSLAATMKIAGFSMESTKRLFESTTSSMRALGTPDKKQDQVWHAINTIFSTDKVTANQLHRQLDPVLHGFQTELAKVVYESLHNLPQGSVNWTDELVKKAQAELTDALSKGRVKPGAIVAAMGQYQQTTSPGLSTAIESPTSALNRFRNKWIETEDMMNKSGVWKQMGIEFDHLANMLQQNNVQELFKNIALGIADAIRHMGSALQWAANHTRLLMDVFGVFMALGTIEFTSRLGGAFSNTSRLIGLAISPITGAASALRSLTAAQVAFNATQRASNASLLASKAAQAASSAASSPFTSRMSMAIGSPVVANGWTLAEAEAAAAAASATSLSRFSTMSRAISSVGSLATNAALSWAGVLTGVGVAAAGVTALLYANRDEVTSYGKVNVTVTTELAAKWESFKETFTSILNSISSMFKSVWSGMADVAKSAIDRIAATSKEGWGGVGLDILANVQAVGENTWHGVVDRLTGGPRTPMVTASDIRARDQARARDIELQQQEKARAEAAARESADYNSFEGRRGRAMSSPLPEKLEITGDPKPGKGKTPAEKMQDQLDSVTKALTPDLSEVERFAEQMKTIAEAQKMGIHSQGALSIAGKMDGGVDGAQGKAYLSGEYARAIEAAKEKIREADGTATPYEKTLRDLEITQQKLNAAVAVGARTQEDANARMAVATEHAQKVLNPFGEYTKDLNKEIALLQMSSREREVYTKLLDMEKKAKEDGHPLNQAEIDALQRQITLEVQLEKVKKDQNVGIQAWANSFEDLYTELGKVEQKIAGDLTNAMTKFIEGPKAWLKEGGIKKLGMQMQDQILQATTQDAMRSATDFIGLTNGPNQDAHGSKLLGPLASMLGIAQKPGTDVQNPINKVLTSDGTALQVSIVGRNGDTTGTAAGSSAPAAGGVASLAALAGKPQAASALSSGQGLLNSKGLFGSDGELFGKDGLMGSAGPFSATGLFGSKGPILGNESFFGQNSWVDQTFGKNSLGGSNGFFGNLFGTAGSDSAANAVKTTVTDASGMASAGSSTGGGLFSGIGSLFSSLFSLGAAEGGYAGQTPGVFKSSASQWVGRTIPHYAEGVQNTSGGIPSVLHPNEAVIPLSRGRKIPIEMPGNGGQGASGPIHVHFNVSTPDADSFRASQGQIHTALGNSIQRAVGRNGG